MIINVADHKKYLYHYTSAQAAIEYILKGRTLRLSSHSSTNDPKERKGWLFDLQPAKGATLDGTIEKSPLDGYRGSSRARPLWPACHKTLVP